MLLWTTKGYLCLHTGLTPQAVAEHNAALRDDRQKTKTSWCHFLHQYSILIFFFYFWLSCRSAFSSQFLIQFYYLGHFLRRAHRKQPDIKLWSVYQAQHAPRAPFPPPGMRVQLVWAFGPNSAIFLIILFDLVQNEQFGDLLSRHHFPARNIYIFDIGAQSFIRLVTFMAEGD